MKFINDNFLAISRILLVILLIIFILLISGRKEKEQIITTQIDTVVTIKTLTKYTKGDDIPFKVLDTIFTNIYKEKHDTAYIVKDYNQIKEYTDSIKQENNLYVIKDTISQNKIIGRSFKAQVQEKTITITNNIQAKNKAVLYLGLRSDISRDYTKMNHNITLSLKTRNKSLYSIGYGMSGYSIGYSIKL
jgi:hypothetical protein